MNEQRMEQIVSLAKRRGFIWQGSEVYGGMRGTWDYGPLGLALKRKIMNEWWDFFVENREDMFGVDAAIIMNPKVWQASGHVETFSDPLIECNYCKSRYRFDNIIDEKSYHDFMNLVDRKADLILEKQEKELNEIEELIDRGGCDIDSLKKRIGRVESRDIVFDKFNVDDVVLGYKYTGKIPAYFLNNVAIYKCEKCGHCDWSEAKPFNMMFQTNVGAVVNENSVAYLRPETAQGIFTNYKNVVDSFYPSLPFGLAQQGKAFRNEISPRDFVFRSREFEQMEIEYFVHPETWQENFEKLLADTLEFLTEKMGLSKEKIHLLEVPEEDRAHYSKRTVDLEFDFPIGKEELMGIAYRTDFDLGNIQRASGKNMEYTDKVSKDKFIPHVIEPSFGVERLLMAVLTQAYRQEEIDGKVRTWLALSENLAPTRIIVAPLLKNKEALVEKAREVYAVLKKKYGNVEFDLSGKIGKVYAKADEIGVPKVVVVDFDTIENDGLVSVRNRDDASQVRVKIEEV